MSRSGLLLVVVAAIVGGCLEPTSSFGARCVSVADCDGLQCRSVDDSGPHCVPPRERGDAGERCDNAIVARAGAGLAIVDDVVFFGSADDDADVCGNVGVPDVSLRFSLASDSGLRITVDRPGVKVALRPITDGICGAVERFGCASTAEDALLQHVVAGDWELVVDGVVDDAGDVNEAGVHVRVERLDCPLDSLPFDNDTCLGFTAQQTMLRARAGAAGAIINGAALFVGGIGKDGEARAEVDRFDLESRTFSFADIDVARARPLVLVAESTLGDAAFVFSNNDNRIGEIVSFNFADDSDFDVVAAEPGEVYAVVPGPKPVVLADIGIVTPVVRRPGCVFSNCLFGESCVAQQCVCDPNDGCTPRVQPSLASRGAGADFVAGIRGVSADDGRAIVVASALPGRGYRVFVPALPDFLERRPVEQPPRADGRAAERRSPGLVADGRFVWSFGGTFVADDAPSDIIELVDLAAESAEVLDVRLPVPMARVEAVRLLDRYVVLSDLDALTDEVTVFDLIDRRLVRSPSLPAPRRDATLLSGDGGVFFGGGFDKSDVASSDLLQLRTSPRTAPPPPEPPSHCSARDLLPNTPTLGSTAGQADRFRDPLCFFSGLVGDEQWHLRLDESSNVRLRVEPRDSSVIGWHITVTEGLCAEESVVVACGFDSVDIPTLDAGDWFVSVESVASERFQQSLLQGRPYLISALIGAPDVCELDPADPADDVVTGARTLRDGFIQAVAPSGVLCAGDVEFVVFEYIGGGVDFGVPDSGVGIAAAVLDTEASTPEHLVASGILGDPVPLPAWEESDPPAGVYVARLGPFNDVAGSFSWEASLFNFCVADPFDSSVEAVDDATRLTAPRLHSGESIDLSFCTISDRDVVVFEPVADRAISVSISRGTADFRVEPFDLDGPNALGAPLDAEIVVVDPEFGPTLVRLPPRDAPFAVRISPVDTFSDVSVELNQPPPGDTCETALPLPASGAFSTPSREFADDINAGDIGDCTTFGSPGEDFVFFVDLERGDVFNATVHPTDDTDVALYLLTDCPSGVFGEDLCAAGSDEGGNGDDDSIEFVNNGAANRFFFVVDSFSGNNYNVDVSWTIR